MSDPYAVPSDPAKRHSAALTDGVDRAAARAMLKGIGMDDEALSRPLVGIATTWIETMPCNWNQRELARHVRRGIIEAEHTIRSAVGDNRDRAVRCPLQDAFAEMIEVIRERQSAAHDIVNICVLNRTAGRRHGIAVVHLP